MLSLPFSALKHDLKYEEQKAIDVTESRGAPASLLKKARAALDREAAVHAVGSS